MLKKNRLQKKYQNKLTFRYLTIATVFLIVIQLIISSIQNCRQYNQEAERLRERIAGKIDFLSLVTPNAFLRSDTETLQNLARSINQDNDLVYSAFIDQNQNIIAYSIKPDLIANKQLRDRQQSLELTSDLLATINTNSTITEISQPVNIGDRNLGTIKLAYSTLNLQQKLQILSLLDLAYAVLVSFLFATLTWIIFNRQILAPLKKIQHLSKELASGNLDERITLSRKDEIGELADALNTMAAQFQHTLKNLEQVMDEVLIAEKAKGKFLGKMSHELKTPLNGIIGFTQLMQQESNTTLEQLENLDIIEKNSLHLLKLINDVLEITKIESGKSSLNLSKFDLYQLLSSIEHMFRFKAQEKNIQLLFEIHSDVPQYIENDEDKLKQVLVNLLDNSLKFTNRGKVILAVKKKTNPLQNSTQSLYFKISDTGQGISPKDIDRLFVTFAQTENGITTTDGMGLGLPMSKQFIQLMGGEISLKSELSKGTTVRFSIPLTEVDVTDLNFPQSYCFEANSSDIDALDSVESQFFYNPGLSYDLTRNKLAAMPSEWLVELQESTTKVDNDAIMAILERIPNQDQDLKQALIDLIENFRYDSILELTDNALSQKK